VIETPDVIITALQHAADLVRDADLPEDLRPVAFQLILSRALSQLEPERAPVAPDAATPVAAPVADSNSRIAMISAKIGLPIESIERFYDPSKAELELVIPRSKLPLQKRRAARSIALIYAGGDQAAYSREWTQVSAIREMCKSYNVFDSANFASTIAEAGDALVVRGKALQREVKVTRPGYEQLAELLRGLL
jgi:hypothetical protein